MDFLICNFRIPATDLKKAFQKANINENEISVLIERDGGSACLTETKYLGLNPVLTGDELFAVSGDPLIFSSRISNAPTSPTNRANARTREIIHAWHDAGLAFPSRFQPRHPGLMLRCNLIEGRIELVTDQAGFVPAYYCITNRGVLVASSPDLIAALIMPEMDYVSAMEKLGSGQISYPYTLYREVLQVRPAAYVTIENNHVEATCWWVPPEQDTINVDKECHVQKVRNKLNDFLDRLSSNLGSTGHLTLSAGIDTRFLADGILAHGVLDVTALCSTAVRNLESWTAEKTASALGLKFRHVPRPLDHHARCILQPPYRLTSSSGWEHAHFFLNGLGEIWPKTFLLGGYRADAHLENGDLFHSARRKALKSGFLCGLSADWATSRIANSIPAKIQNEILIRREEARQEFGFTDSHSASLAQIWPFSAVISNAHFGALRRCYPSYEFFMTSEVVDLAFRIPDSEKVPGLKSQLLAPMHNELEAIPINPASSQEIQKTFWQFKKFLPEELWPEHILHAGAWSEKSGALKVLIQQRIEAAIQETEALLGIDISTEDINHRGCYEIIAARRLCRNGIREAPAN